LDFAALARAPGTLVLFMGLARLPAIAAGLIVHGADPATPAAVIAGGTTAAGEAVTAPLEEIAAAGADRHRQRRLPRRPDRPGRAPPADAPRPPEPGAARPRRRGLAG